MKTVLQEWKNLFKNKLLLISFIVICIIPLLYAAFFLRSIWDPYNNTENLPVAIVNKDKAITFNGKQLNVGEELVSQLRDNKDLNWHFVSERDAIKGIKNMEYYMVVTIPDDFSTNAATVLDEKPKQMKLIYQTNGSLNYLGEVVSETAAKQLQQEVGRTVTENYTKVMFEQVKVAGKGLNEAGIGAIKLDEGANQLNDGSKQLTSNLDLLASSTLQFNNGVNKYSKGINQYVTGVKQISDGSTKLNIGIIQLSKKLPTLTTGISSLTSGSTTLDSGIQQYTAGVAQTTAGSNQLVTNNAQLMVGLAQLKQDPNYAQLATGLEQYLTSANQVNAGLNALNTKSNSLVVGSAQVMGGLKELQGNVPVLSQGINQLVGGSNTLKAGTDKISENNATLVSGAQAIDETAIKLNDASNQLAEGAKKLDGGLTELNAGTSSLADGLKAGSSQLNGVNLNDKNAAMFSYPDKLVHDKYSDVPNYGHALAPYVLSLALYVGCLVFNFIMPIRKVSIEGATTFSWRISKISLGMVAAFLMSMIEVIVMLALGLEPVYLFNLFVIAFLSAFAYMFLIMVLALTFDNPGRFIAMLLLILQLAGAGGTFPIQLSDSFFNLIHPFLPMTYSILGFRDALTSGIGANTFVSSFVILLTIALASIGLMYLAMNYLKRKHLQNKSQLDNNQELLATNY